MTELTPYLISMTFAGLLSLLASYAPGFRTWWGGLAADTKQAVTALAMIVLGVLIYAMACIPALGFPFVACPSGGVWALVGIILSALTSSQVVDRVSPDLPDVRGAKAARDERIEYEQARPASTGPMAIKKQQG